MDIDIPDTSIKFELSTSYTKAKRMVDRWTEETKTGRTASPIVLELTSGEILIISHGGGSTGRLAHYVKIHRLSQEKKVIILCCHPQKVSRRYKTLSNLIVWPHWPGVVGFELVKKGDSPRIWAMVDWMSEKF